MKNRMHEKKAARTTKHGFDDHEWSEWERYPDYDTTLHCYIRRCACGASSKEWRFTWAETDKEHYEKHGYNQPPPGLASTLDSPTARPRRSTPTTATTARPSTRRATRA